MTLSSTKSEQRAILAAGAVGLLVSTVGFGFLLADHDGSVARFARLAGVCIVVTSAIRYAVNRPRSSPSPSPSLR